MKSGATEEDLPGKSCSIPLLPKTSKEERERTWNTLIIFLLVLSSPVSVSLWLRPIRIQKGSNLLGHKVERIIDCREGNRRTITKTQENTSSFAFLKSVIVRWLVSSNQLLSEEGHSPGSQLGDHWQSGLGYWLPQVQILLLSVYFLACLASYSCLASFLGK